MFSQLVAVAIGGASGSILRFLVSNGVYQWLGRGFPYGTLAVNVLGSFLMGLLVEVLILQRVSMAVEYRAAILVGLFGSFTTFSTFSLETVYLIEQGHFGKAAVNIGVSVLACLAAVWIGLLSGRLLTLYSGGVIRSMGWAFPYAMGAINATGALLIGLVASLLVHKLVLSPEYRAAVYVIGAGAFVTFSGLYLILYLIEDEHPFDSNTNWMVGVFLINAALCSLALWSGFWLGKKL
ncbi:MAG: hypothetical protein Kow0065_19350 [Methylomicrobium sp.]